jgi:hypothetical protein
MSLGHSDILKKMLSSEMHMQTFYIMNIEPN